ncbi:MAG: WG repeat-containing protein [Bacteroidales bacterium]|nr:WG repeat-containing protein [Bacteroidales bacterium]
MKPRLLAIIFFSLACAGAAAQNLQVVSDKKGRIGFADAEGKIVVKCEYTAALPFDSGFARVCKKDSWGLIDAAGKVVLQPKYDEISAFDGPVAKVRLGNNYGLINTRGEWVLTTEYMHISPFNSRGMAWIAKGTLKSDGQKYRIDNGRVGIVSKEDGLLIDAVYNGLAEFVSKPNDWTGYSTGSKIITYRLLDTLRTDCAFLAYDKIGRGPLISPGLIDGKTGQIIVKNGVYRKICRPVGGMMRFYNQPSKNGISYGYYNLATGKSFTCPVADLSGGRESTHSDFIGDIAFVISGQEKSSDNKWQASGYVAINKEGKIVRDNIIHVKFGAGKTDGSGYWAIYEKNADGGEVCKVTDENGRPLFNNTACSDVHFPVPGGNEEELFCFRKDGFWGVTTRDETVRIPFEWDDICPPAHGVASVCRNGKWGLLLTDGREWVPPLYAAIASDTADRPANVFVQTEPEIWHNLKVGNAGPYKRNYSLTGTFNDGYSWVRTQGLTLENNIFNKSQKMGEEDEVMGLIINSEDEIVVPVPVARKFFPQFCRELRKSGGALTLLQARRLILSLTTDVRNSPMSAIVPEDEWDY